VSKVVRIKADLVKILEKKFPEKPLKDVIDNLLRKALEIPVTPVTEDVTTQLGRFREWLMTYGRKIERALKIVKIASSKTENCHSKSTSASYD